MKADVIVLGAGMVGVSAAVQLLKRGRSVLRQRAAITRRPSVVGRWATPIVAGQRPDRVSGANVRKGHKLARSEPADR